MLNLKIRDLMMRLKNHKIEFSMNNYHAIPGGKVIKYKCGTRDTVREMIYIFDHAGNFVSCKCKLNFVDSI